RDGQRQRLRPRERRLDHHLLHPGDHLGHRLLPNQGIREPRVSTSEHVEATAIPAARARVAQPQHRPRLKDTWWRHAVGIIAIVASLSPVVYTLSSAFTRDNSPQGASLVPTHVTLHNFGNLLHNNVTTTSGGKADAPYLNWIVNSMIIAGATAIFATLLGAFAAYAFSRFRFKGRRIGMLTLLLIQSFPPFAAIAGS